MKALVIVLASLVVAFAAVAPVRAASSGKVLCGGVHGPRAGNTELVDTSIGFRNANLNPGHDVHISRLTIRNFFGDVVRDFGDTGPSGTLPPNTDFPVPVDVTTVPPGANYYLTTSHIFGTRFIDDNVPAGGGNNISIVVEFTTSGDPDLFLLGGSLRIVELIGGPGGARGQEHTRSTLDCRALK